MNRPSKRAKVELSDGLESNAMDVSADGLVIVGNSNTTPFGDTRAFRWENGVMTNLGSLPGEDGSGAWAVSADGSVIVGGAAHGSDSVPFVWDATNGMRNIQDVLVDDLGLNLDGWTLHGNAEDVTADGLTMIGFGTNPDGYTEAWIAHIPEPATLWLLAAGGLGLMRRRRVPVGARSS